MNSTSSISNNQINEHGTREFLNTKEKADIILQFINTAYRRFDQQFESAWRIRLSIWTSLGIASGFVLASDKWEPNLIECVIGIMLTIAVVYVVVFIWGPWMHRRASRFIRVARFWENELEHFVGVGLPEFLLAKNWHKTDGWSSDTKLGQWYNQPIYLSQALITFFFGLMVIIALLSKMS